MISFSKQIKNEFLSADISAYCCSAAELAAYIYLLGKKTDNSVEITVDNEEFAARICALACKVLKTSVNFLKLGNTCSIMLNCGNKFNEKYSFLYKNIEDEKTFIDAYKKNCCRAAFVKGVFLSAGTIIDPEKTYNIEFSFKSADIAKKISCLFEECGFGLKTAVRKSNYILYVKKSDTICDILTFMGAYKAQMKILNLKIERELRSEVNRSSNGETANLDKTLEASIRHITAIEKISRVKGLDYLPQELFETATLRLMYRDLSLEELGKKLNPPITKSGINHRLNKIMKIADTL